MAVIEISSEEFAKTVLESQTPVFVDFWAEWCGPCRRVAPVVEELEAEYSDEVLFVKIDVDKEPDIANEYGVLSIPTFIVFEDGAEKERFIGFRSKEDLERMLGK